MLLLLQQNITPKHTETPNSKTYESTDASYSEIIFNLYWSIIEKLYVALNKISVGEHWSFLINISVEYFISSCDLTTAPTFFYCANLAAIVFG